MEGDVSFQEEPSAAPVYAAKKPLMIRFVLSSGVAKTDEEATYVLLGAAALILILAAIPWLIGGASHKPVVEPPAAPGGTAPVPQ